MIRSPVAGDRSAGRGPRGPGPRRGWLAAAGFAAALGAGLLVVYLAHPLTGGHRLPIGPDGPVYTWWSRLAAVEGLGVISQRPGVPGLTLVLGAVFGTEPVQTLAVLGPVLAAACGLAGAALVEAVGGPSRGRAAVAGALVGAFAGYLAAGWLANLALAVLLLGATAALGLSLRSWRGVVAGAALLAAAGLSHLPFLVASLAILGGLVLLLVPEAVRSLRTGARPLDTLAGRLAIGAAGGAGAAAAGFALLGGGALRVDTSQDALLRRVGLRGVLGDWLRERLLVDGRRAVLPVAATAWLGWTGLRPGARVGVGAQDRRAPDPGGLGFVLALCASWAAVTVAGILILALTGRGPANRLLPFAFFVPLLGALGLHAIVRRSGARRLVKAGAWLAGLAIAAAGLYGWVDRPPFVEPDELVAADRAARSVAPLPPGTPLVFLVDTTEEAAGFHAVRFANVIRMALPPNQLRDLRVVMASPDDFLAGRPTRTGDPEHDRISQVTVEETAPLAGEGAVLVVRAFNEPGYAQALRMGNEVAPGVVALTGWESASTTPSGPRAEPPVGLGPGALVALSFVSLGLLWVTGLGWARWALPGASALAASAAAPSAGLAVAVLGAFVVDRLGMALMGPAAPALVAVLGALGYLAAWAVASRSRRGAVNPS